MKKLNNFIILIFITLNIIGIFYNGYIFISQSETQFMRCILRIFYSILSLITLLVFSKINLKFYFKYAGIIYLGILFLIILPLLPYIGIEKLGARRWIRLPYITIQPAEFAKLSLVIFLSTILGKYFFLNRNEKPDIFVNFLLNKINLKPEVIPFIGFLVYGIIIIIQKDLGMLIFLGLLTISILLVRRNTLSFVFISLIILSILATLFLLYSPHRRARIIAFLNPEKYKKTIGYQLWHSLTGIGTGGLWGKGPGNSDEIYYMSETENDFIFTIIAEEIGFVGITFLLMLYLLTIISGLYISYKLSFLPYKFLSIGITNIFGLQAIINLMVVTGLLPTKGLPLPIISYGGTSLILNGMLFGILLKLGKEIK